MPALEHTTADFVKNTTAFIDDLKTIFTSEQLSAIIDIQELTLLGKTLTDPDTPVTTADHTIELMIGHINDSLENIITNVTPIEDLSYIQQNIDSILAKERHKQDPTHPAYDTRNFEDSDFLVALSHPINESIIAIGHARTNIRAQSLFFGDDQIQTEHSLLDPKPSFIDTHHIKDLIHHEADLSSQLDHLTERAGGLTFDPPNPATFTKTDGLYQTNTHTMTTSRQTRGHLKRFAHQQIPERLLATTANNPEPHWIQGPQSYDPDHVHRTLDNLYPDNTDTLFIHSGAPGTLDVVDQWLLNNRKPHIVLRPDFSDPKHKRSAPFRNIERIARGISDLTHKQKLQPTTLVLFSDPSVSPQSGLILNSAQRAAEHGITVINVDTKPLEHSQDNLEATIEPPDDLTRDMLESSDPDTIDFEHEI